MKIGTLYILLGTDRPMPFEVYLPCLETLTLKFLNLLAVASNYLVRY